MTVRRGGRRVRHWSGHSFGGSSVIGVRALHEASRDTAERVAAALARKGIDAQVGPVPSRHLVLCGDGQSGELDRQVDAARRCGADRVIVVTDPEPPPEQIWACLRAGARDVIPPDLLRTLPDRFSRWAEVDALVDAPLVATNLVGRSAVWLDVLRDVVETARFADSAVHVTGESGTGKELVARLVHAVDPRPRKKDLVVLDCTTVQPTLAGSEFFGHERGAFTGAHTSRDGAFALADGGTLFLDEVGDLPLGLQAELLRVLQEGTYKPVGSNTWRKTAFRLVSATHRDLREEVAAGRFRQDLYFRLATATFRLPALRERPEDVPTVAEHFLRALRPDVPGFDRLVLAHLVTRPWPGNVRELRQVVSRLATRHVGNGPITVGDLAPEDRPAAGEHAPRGADLEQAIRSTLARGLGLEELAREVKELAVELVCREENGNLQRAAQRLRVTDRALQLRRKNGRAEP